MSEDVSELPWIEADQTPWGVRVLDLRPITQTMLSTSSNPQMAENAVSYGGSDGREFIGQTPSNQTTIAADLRFATAPALAPGVLFIPNAMEQKWAVFFYEQQILFVRSWLREVHVIANTVQHADELRIVSITGQFTPDEPPAFTQAVARFIIASHVLNTVVPAPLPLELIDNSYGAGMWAMSLYGDQAYVGTFDPLLAPPLEQPLRSHSLLHIAVARGDFEHVAALLNQGWSGELLAGDGLTPLHWALAADEPAMVEWLIKAGIHPDVRSAEGATPLMNAVQSGNEMMVATLLIHGADVNAGDLRGFTALHRAAEMGKREIVRQLLAHGANPSVAAQGYTPLDLATMQQHQEIVALLQG